MNNERIESALRSYAAPEMPDGMRDRVLARAQSEVQPSMFRRLHTHRQRLLVAVMLVAVVGSASLDAARQRRIHTMLFGATPTAAGRGRVGRTPTPDAQPNVGTGGDPANTPTRDPRRGEEMHLITLAMAISAARNPEGG